MRDTVAGLALALTAAGCSYDFRNPAEQLGMGQALGRAVVETGGAAQPLAGTYIALESSPYFGQVTKSSGRFTLLALPIGEHRVLFRKGTEFATQRIVQIAPGDDGKPEGVNLGDVRLRRGVTVQGTVTLPTGLQTYMFTSAVVDVTDETSGQPAALSTGGGGEIQYTFRGLATGPHRIRFAFTGLRFGYTLSSSAPPLDLQIPDSSEGQLLSFNPVALEPEPVSTVPGSLRFRIQAVGPSSAAAAAGATVSLFDPLHVASGAVDVLTPDSAGWVQGDVGPGLYLVRITPPPVSGQPPAEVFYEAPPEFNLLVHAGQPTEGGTVYLVDSSTGTSAALACFSDADCSGGGRCVGGLCQGGTFTPPPDVAPFSLPFCSPNPGCGSVFNSPCGIGGSCGFDCSDGWNAVPTCFPPGGSCTPDGVRVTYPAPSCF